MKLLYITFKSLMENQDWLCRVKSLKSNKILDWSKPRALADDETGFDRKTDICFGNGRKHSRKRRKCWLPAFSPFPTMFSRLFFQGR